MPTLQVMQWAMPTRQVMQNQTYFQSDNWYQASTLKERIALLKENPQLCKNIESKINTQASKLEKWRLPNIFTNNSDFTQRLTLDGITESEFIYLLNQPNNELLSAFSEVPAWLAKLESAYSIPESIYNYKFPDVEFLPDNKMSGLMYIVEPLITQAYEHLKAELKALNKTGEKLPFDPNTILDILFTNLPAQLIGKLSRTLILELHVARLQGKLQGETSQERFGSFLTLLRKPETAISLLQEYPVLARQLVICIENWLNFSIEFLQHLCQDWQEICPNFSPESDPGVLVSLDAGVGDKHRYGRSVLIAEFSNGLRVVYKPRSLAVDVHFQELLTWINERGNHPPFQTLKIINRKNYGWVEFISAASCSSQTQIQRFYQRQGGYLALLYALEATDFHAENLIAVGEQPILIDLEALFHPRISADSFTRASELASHNIFASVLRVSLLPQRFLSNQDYEGIDISGLGAKAGQLTPKDIAYLQAEGTDEIQVARRRMEIAKTQHRPTLNQADVNITDYLQELVTGFKDIYQLLLQHREELLGDNSPLNCFAEDEVRVVARSTRFYSTLLNESFHPDVLRNALERERLFERLWYGISFDSNAAKIVPLEREQLWNGDVPLFTTRPNSRSLYSSTGEEVVNCLSEASMNLVKRRLLSLSEKDLQQQIWFTRAAVSTVAMGDERAPMPAYQITPPQTQITRERLLAAACDIGDRLESLAIRGQDDATWIGLTLVNHSYWTLVPLDLELYNGVTGVALFLAYLSEITIKPSYKKLAESALKTIQQQIQTSHSQMHFLGFGGWGGVIYTMQHLGVLWHQPELLDAAEDIVKRLPALIERDENLDIIAGVSGCIGAIASLYRSRATENILQTAILCGERLISQAQLQKQGIGWLQKGPKGTGERALSGFSHGGAGMAWALLQVFALTGEERFRTAATSAITYERSLFSPERNNWQDLRGVDNQEEFMVAWCHGASGIGLARLSTIPYLDDELIREEINIALQTTLTHGFGGNHSLCHGDLGNLDFLLKASLTIAPEWKKQVESLSAIILESIEKYGWLCGVPLGVESPGLMTGLAGIGWGLLRLAAPDFVPSVLIMEPPASFTKKNIE